MIKTHFGFILMKMPATFGFCGGEARTRPEFLQSPIENMNLSAHITLEASNHFILSFGLRSHLEISTSLAFTCFYLFIIDHEPNSP